MLPLLGSLISAGANLFSGSQAASAQQAANAANAQQAAENIKLQKKFAQEGIRWKVADAKAAGIHPLYALGASTHSFAPVSVGAEPVTGMAQGLAAAGQDVSCAINATRTGAEQNAAVAKTMADLSVKNMALRNDLLSAQISKINQAGSSPPMGGDRSTQVFENSPALKTPGIERKAEDVEAEYGELASDAAGGVRALRDALRAHGVPLGKSPGEYSKLLSQWLLSDAAKTSVSVMPGSPLDKFLKSILGRR